MTVAELSANRILKLLPDSTMGTLAPLCRIDSFPAGATLQPADEDIRDCYFPLSGMGSLIVTEASGKSVDTAIVGAEGFIGLPVFLGTGRMPVEAMVQLDLQAAVIGAGDLRRVLPEEPALANLLHRYSQMVLVELARLVLCNRVHPLEERIARWLLQVHDRVGNEAPLDITHQFLSEMVGGERPSTTLAMHRLAEMELVDTARATITITDPAGLEAIACDCYRTIRNELDRLMDQRGETAAV
jgi:CRP-like cAMP-binding protein